MYRSNVFIPRSPASCLPSRMMYVVLITLLLCTGQILSQGVGIGTIAPHPSAVLELASDTSGILIPRMSALLRDAINAPATGLMVYTTDDDSYYYFNGSGWERVGARALVLQDADADTKIQVEKSADEDIIHYDLAGTEYFRMVNGRLEFRNTGHSVLIGRGAGALDDFSDNNNNTFVGDSTGALSTAVNSTAVGTYALKKADGQQNTALGFAVMENTVSGDYNVGIGNSVMRYMSTGNANIGIGNTSLRTLDAGSNNVAVGNATLNYNINGSNNTAVGYQAGVNTLGSGNVLLGYQAGYNETGSNRLYIQNSNANSTSALIYGEFDNSLLRINGKLIATQGFSDADFDTKIRLDKTPDDDQIRFDMGGVEYFRMSHGRLEVINTGSSLFIGKGAGAYDDLAEKSNIAIGDSVMAYNTLGDVNAAVGFHALKSNTAGDRNIAFGADALNQNTTGSQNTACGYGSLISNAAGSKNVAIGSGAGAAATGSGNVFIGCNTGMLETGSNRLYIDNDGYSANNTLIYGEFDNNIVALNAAVGIGTISPDAKLHVAAGNILADRGGFMANATRTLTLGGVRSGNAAYAGLVFKNYDSNNSAVDYIGAQITSENVGGNEVGDLRFYTASSSSQLALAMAIDTNGDVAIGGITSAINALDVNGSMSVGLGGTEAAPAGGMLIAGNVGIGTPIPDAMLTVNGTVSKPGGGAWATFSDARLKDVGENYTRGLDEISRLQPVFFNYKAGNPQGLPSDVTYVGFVAQEVQKVIPEAVDSSGEYLSLNADPIYWALLNAIKELKAENDAAQDTIDSMRNENAILRQELSEYQFHVEARLNALERRGVVESVEGK